MGYYDEETFEKMPALEFLDNEQNEFIGCTFKSINFSDHSLKGQKFSECHFINCNLSNTEMMGSTFRDIEFQSCKMVGVNWSRSGSFSRILVNDSILNYSVFQRMMLKYFQCTNSTANEVDFTEADLENSNFSNSSLINSSFSNCNLARTDFRGATGYMIDAKYTNIKKAKFNLPEAVALLEAFDIELS